VSTTKRQILIQICEIPGWQAPEDSSTIDRFLSELQNEGWVNARLGGYEATSQALDSYPQFLGQADIADGEPPPPVDGVPVERVAYLLGALLCEMPLAKVLALTKVVPATGIPADVLEIAQSIAQQMRN
jgi:hypothetical protein